MHASSKLITQCIVFDSEQPTIQNLTLIKWKDIHKEKLSVKQSICNDWKEIGILLHIPMEILRRWETKYMRDSLDCINEVLSYWLENPTIDYPISWEGLYELLEDAGHSEVVQKLKKAVDTLHNSCTN